MAKPSASPELTSSPPGEARSRHRLLSPRHWPSWLLVGVLRLLPLLPYPWLMALGRRLGRLSAVLVPYRREVARANLTLCFPELPATEREVLLLRHLEAMGMGVMEMAAAWWAADRKLAGLGQIEGLDHLQVALKRGRGALLVSGHFSAFEMAGRLLLREQPACFTYREFRNPVLHAVMERARRRRCARMIHRHDVRGFIRALRANEVVWYAPDQDPGRRRGVFVPFFGVPAASLPATSRLAAATGAAVLPFGMRRLPNDDGYRLTICPPLAGFPSGDVVPDTERLTALLEQEIRAVPEQYLWVHRRFKTRPEGRATFYPQNLRRLRRRRKRNGP